MTIPDNEDIPENGASDVGTTITDPFGSRYAVPVVGGTLTVAHAGPPPDRADAVVLAIHGITANLMMWRAVARELARNTRVCILAPDLRGRGESTGLRGPYGLAAHVADMLAVLDHLGVQRAVLVGHSMGAYLAARIAAEHPERVASLVLVDGGVPVGEISDETAAAAGALTVGPALARRAITFTSDEAYLDFWHHHPAFLEAWNDDVEAYVLYDLSGKPGARRYQINADAVAADSDEMLWNPSNRDMIDRADVPVGLLRAARGALNDENPLIPQHALDTFIAENPAAEVEQIENVNHYTVMLGEGPGPARVAAAIDAAARALNGA
jgi:pimeloyl-ACP methyl ester carboxylesterase